MKNIELCLKICPKSPKKVNLNQFIGINSPKNHHLKTKQSNNMFVMKEKEEMFYQKIKNKPHTRSKANILNSKQSQYQRNRQIQLSQQLKLLSTKATTKSSNKLHIEKAKNKQHSDILHLSKTFSKKQKLIHKSQSTKDILPKQKKITKKKILKLSKHIHTQFIAQNQHSNMLNKLVTRIPSSQTSLHSPLTTPSSKKMPFLKKVQKQVDSFQRLQLQSQDFYYIGNLLKSDFFFKEHLQVCLSTLKMCDQIKMPTLRQLSKHIPDLPPTEAPYTFVLDLDETLIHCNEGTLRHHTIQVPFPTGEVITAGINIRPFARLFLRELSKIGEVIVFTASHEFYANVVLDLLDPRSKYISHRLFRSNCWNVDEKTYIKDLRVLKNRKIQNVLLVDNAAHSYCFQLSNGVPIVPYYDDQNDQQLKNVLKYIKMIVGLRDKFQDKSLAEINGEYFQMGKYIQYNTVNAIINKVYKHSKK